MSLVTYVTHIFHATHITFLKYSQDPPKSEVCQHIRKCRVFQLGEHFMRIYADFLVLSPEFKLSAD